MGKEEYAGDEVALDAGDEPALVEGDSTSGRRNLQI